MTEQGDHFWPVDHYGGGTSTVVFNRMEKQGQSPAAWTNVQGGLGPPLLSGGDSNAEYQRNRKQIHGLTIDD